MKNTTIGVDTSTSSTTLTTTIDEVTDNGADNKPAVPFLARPENIGVVCTVVNSIVTPSLQILLASVLGTVDASVPNKEQNKAIKHLLRKQFDDAYLNIQRLSYPDMNLGVSGGEYYLAPNPTAFAQGTIRQ